MEFSTIYDLLVQVIGTPADEWGVYVLYVCSCFVFVFVCYMILNIFLGFFRWIWGRY